MTSSSRFKEREERSQLLMGRQKGNVCVAMHKNRHKDMLRTCCFYPKNNGKVAKLGVNHGQLCVLIMTLAMQ